MFWTGSVWSEVRVAAVTLGAFLAAKRGERGLTLQQAASATHIRLEHLSALEADEPELIPAPVYARGYLRTYARYLGLDEESLVAKLPRPVQDPRETLGLGTLTPRPRVVLTGPAAALAGLLLLAGAFVFYAWRQVESDQRGTIINAPATPAVYSPLVTPPPSLSQSSHTSS
ncbi:MAG: helix-turn-helix domain-containing protein [Chloroflexi bacterium]|nr:MAG: helix-turn-helix domain-containing protein [Chloroflexota bacterium]